MTLTNIASRVSRVVVRVTARAVLRAAFRASAASLLLFSAACRHDDLITDPTDPVVPPPGSTDTTTARSTTGPTLNSLGLGAVADRWTAEVWTRGATAYTTTWGTRGAARGNAVKIWDVSGGTPLLVDSVIVANAGTLGDVQTSDDGTLLVVAIESNPNGGLAIYQLDTPTKPRLLVRTTIASLAAGVHTAEVARVNGKLYAFCAMDPTSTLPARLVIMDLSNPANPTQVTSLVLGMPFIHDVFVRDGILFTAEWHDGTGIWDIGGLGNGSVAAPRRVSLTKTVGGSVHNLWWYHDGATGSKRYVFVGEEGPGSIGSTSRGDIHVLDVSNLAQPREVAAFNVPGAGVHNVWADEENGLLYAAYYNAGVRVLDVRGDLGACPTTQQFSDGRCDLGLMGREKARFSPTTPVYVWGVHMVGGSLYASDMINGLWKIQRSVR